jgi:hypothetical protein
MYKFFLIVSIFGFFQIASIGQTIVTVSNVQLVTTAGTEIVVQGGIDFTSGATAVNNGTITLNNNPAAGAENWINNTGGSFLTGNGLVNFRGASNQSIIGNNSFYNLRADNGAKVIYTGTTPLIISNQLYLDGTTKLQIPTGVSANVTNPALTSISTNGVFDNNFILGKLQRATNTNTGEYFFPIGKEVGAMYFYAPIRFTRVVNTTPIDYYAEYFFVQPIDRLNFNNPPVQIVSGVEYWNIASDLLTPANDDVTLSLSYRDSSYVSSSALSRDSLLIVNYSDRGLGNKWNEEGVSANYSTVTGTANFGWVTANALTDNYTTDLFTLGSRSLFNVLPLSNINWSVAVDGNTAFPNWNIFNDQAVAKYIVERSTDGISFSEMSALNSGRNIANGQYRIQDPTLLTQCVYYRLKLIDDRGQVYTMPTKKVCGGSQSYSFKLYPNPAQQEIYLQTPSSASGYKIIITDASGRTVATKVVNNAATQVLNINNLANGAYHLQAIENNTIMFKKLFIKQ